MPPYSRVKHTQKLFEVQQSFKANLPDKISDIQAVWASLCQDKSVEFEDIHLKLHSLVGTAGTFGALAVSLEARKIEQIFKSLLLKETTIDDVLIQTVSHLLQSLQETALKWQPSVIPLIPKSKTNEAEDNLSWRSNIYLVEDDIEIVTPIIDHLAAHGYTVFYYQSIQAFEQAYDKNERASAIIMDMAFNEGQIAGAATIQRLSEKSEIFPPVIFISVHDEIQYRLAAAKVGAKKYITKPVNTSKLLSTLDELTNRKKLNNYRVLLVDDEKNVLEYYRAILEQGNIDVLAVDKPADAYHAIETFKPELIILDLYMGECSGFDLAKIIRQNDDYSYIPIVFLSSELDVSTQLAAMNLGGDDFFIKPVAADFFLQSVVSRVKRARSMNNVNTELLNTLRENKFQLITLDQHAVVSMADTLGIITFVNDHFTDVSGYSEGDLLGKNHRLLKSGMHPDSFYTEMWETISQGKVWRGQVCNRAKNGKNYWLESTIVPFLDEHGLPYKYVSIRTDITRVKLSEKRLTEHQGLLAELSMEASSNYSLLDESEFYYSVTKRIAEVLDIDRASIWLYDDQEKVLLCEKLYNKSTGSWSDGILLDEASYPVYFQKLRGNYIISISDIEKDLASTSFLRKYLKLYNIESILNVPVIRQGKLIGVLSCESVNKNRTWFSDEENFIASVANLISLKLEVYERQQTEIKLIKSKQEADDANRAKSIFLSNMSHELRTPMNAICGFSQLLQLDSEGFSDTQKENINEIIKASAHLLDLINDVLDLARVEAGKVSLSIERVSCAGVINECVSLVQPLCIKRKLTISLEKNCAPLPVAEFAEDDYFIKADYRRLKQVILNLLSNAIKYNAENGNVLINCEKLSNNNIRISITDTGKGIPFEMQSELFVSFNRLEQDHLSSEGAGIGLVIAKNITELMDGKIGVESEVGKGSTFWIELPSDDMNS